MEQTAEPQTHLAPVAFDDYFDGNNPVSRMHLTPGVFLKVMVARSLEGVYVCNYDARLFVLAHKSIDANRACFVADV
jgi:hypothetical protein